MNLNHIRIINGNEIISLLEYKERDIIYCVRNAYVDHYKKLSSLPHSLFLRFPNNTTDRIIALPAYLGGHIQKAGIKWIASFPGNISRNIERASAVMMINSTEHGRVEAILESSVISKTRTAASAALALDRIQEHSKIPIMGFVGCGPINYEVFRYVKALREELSDLVLYDVNPERALIFQKAVNAKYGNSVNIKIYNSLNDVLNSASIFSFATTAGSPYIDDLSSFPDNFVILNISLRDFAPDIILQSTNIVDDIDHVCREKTSIHLAEQKSGGRDFIHSEIGAFLDGDVMIGNLERKGIIFSPFGLGILDLAVSVEIYTLAEKNNIGIKIENFYPDSWIHGLSI